MYELKKIGKVVTRKFVGTGPLSYKKRIYWAEVPQRLRNTGLEGTRITMGHLRKRQLVTAQKLDTQQCVPFALLTYVCCC